MKKFYLKTIFMTALGLLMNGSLMADDVTVTEVVNQNFDDGTSLFTGKSRITVANSDNTVDFYTANNSTNGYSNATYDFGDLTSDATAVKIEFDYLIQNASCNYDVAFIIRDGSVDAGHAKNTMGLNGAFLTIGRTRQSSANYFSINRAKTAGASASNLSLWCHASIYIDRINKNVDYIITDNNGNVIKEEADIAYFNSSADKVSQIDFFACVNSEHDYLDNLVITKYVSSSKVSYTINYVFEGEVIKSETGVNSPGIQINANIPLVVDDQKYYAVDDATTSMVLINGENILNVELRKANEYPYSVTNNFGTVLGEGKYVEGEDAINVYWSKYVQNDGKWYVCDENTYGISISDAVEKVVNYTNEADIAYFFEIEKMSTTRGAATSSTGTGFSGGVALGHYASASFYTNEQLEEGIYNITLVGKSRRSGSTSINVGYCEVIESITQTGEQLTWTNTGSENITMTVKGVFIPAGKSLVLQEATGSNSVTYSDYVILEKVSNVPVTIGSTLYTTFCSEYPLDLAGMPKSVSAYYVTADGVAENAVTLTQIATTVPAGTGLILHAESAGTYNIPVAASAEALEGNLLVGVLTAETVAKEDGFMKYVLAKSGEKAVFQSIGETSANVPAGKAYIKIEESTGGPGAAGDGETPEVNPAKMLNIYLPGEGDATGIKTVDAVEAVADGAIYNLAGQRVGKDYKGIVIMNGKKYLLK